MHQLYTRLQQGIKPWEWDWKRYSGPNQDMVGFFYEDDLACIEIIDAYSKDETWKTRRPQVNFNKR